ncbi:PP2C family protein-serine/threonine phosphatase [Actinosynnema sp. NPDC047251]|uniref:Protein serine/threonine phosphatase n=1 Tax=Saccharothrix espanaensis (strain ATCC 51144 / DSM 44229 / JCM 9112 / NBRC 15066 / NRRL 15764) TaxID=1179773 RepID=K0K9S5_SACES|nr:PP2C family protein-serine/threonine phosphatase [Saccharothrix espanaensis]CCH33383.1 Protein serine/threonine phosphatase [Saccharothrix espanaensis DSM 44229]
MAQGYRQGSEAGLDLDAWRRLVDGFHEAVVVLDPDGVVRLANPLAAVLFPQARPGARAAVTGRAQDLGGGWTACYRGADEFLEDASRRLLKITDRAGTLRNVVDMAPSPHPVVIVPGARGRLEWWRRGPDGDITAARTTRQVATPALAAVLDGTARHAEITEPGDGAWGGATGPGLAVPLAVGGALVCFGGLRDPELLTRYAERAAAAVRVSTLLDDRERAVTALRAHLMPSPLPTVAGVRLAQVYEPAHRGAGVGGDFYDVHPREDGSAAFVLGDVAGNGLEAAVHSGRVRQSLHTLLIVEQRPAHLLTLLNAALRAAGSKLFTTLVVGNLVPVQAGGLRVTLSAGGHPAPLVLRSGGRVDEVAVHGGIVGVLPEVRFQQTTVALGPGETLLLYSDGVTEARAQDDRQDLFGDARLRAALAECAGMSAEAVAEHVRQAVFSWLGPAEHDDLTLLVVQAEG